MILRDDDRSLFVYVEIFMRTQLGGIAARLIDRIARGATIALHSLSYLAALIRGRVSHQGFRARITLVAF